ncbi:ComEA family DNA-binding protein [Testudinibacter sp. P80/BLE/0925]|uniref:ComEA family DNA-binding protein n=1 Tax=Testudinibacter sp. TW-1 TaxID=3417757 RepID=UPI003D35E603
MLSLKSNLKKLSLLALLGTMISAPSFADKTKAAAPSAVTTVETVAAKINLNSATAQELEKGLLGIGAKKAEAIVEYREKNGNFISIDQLSDVSGIGKATLEKNRHLLTL